MSPPPGRKLPEQVETVLFDAGGVLLDLDYSYLKRLIETRGHQVSAMALSKAEALARTEMENRVRQGGQIGEAWRDYFHLILADVGLPGAQHKELIDVLWEAHQRVGLWTAPIPGAREVVELLKGRGLHIGVVSNAEGRVAQDLEAAGYGRQFEAVVDSWLVGVSKPDPEIFRIALREIGMPARSAVYVGDIPAVDVDGARAADVAPILLDRHDLFTAVDAPRLRSIKDLPALLEEP